MTPHLIVLTIYFAGIALAEIPSYMQVCGRRNPQLDACVLRSVEGLRDKLREGIPDLDVPSIEPMTLDKIQLSNDPSFKAVAHDVKLFGFTDFELRTLRVDLLNRRFNLDLNFKKIRLAAIGDIAAKVLVPIVGKGPINIIAEDVDANVTLIYELVNHEDSTRLNFSSMTTKLHIGDYISQFMSHEGSDGVLAEGINTVLCENQQEVLKTITPNLETDVSKLVLQLANRICKSFTFDELFPDHE